MGIDSERLNPRVLGEVCVDVDFPLSGMVVPTIEAPGAAQQLQLVNVSKEV